MTKNVIIKTNKYFYLDILRVIAVMLVIYGHLVTVAMYAPTLPGIINDINLPILQKSFLDILDIKCFLKLGLSAGSFGVCIFFLVTGYLMPMMMDRYTRIGFLINRFFRIIPTLIFAVLFVGAFTYFGAGIEFSLKSYLSSITLTFGLIGQPPVCPVLWTLVIEVIFYFICAITGKFNLKKLIALEILGIAVVALIAISKAENLYSILFHTRFILMILIGSSIYVAKNYSKLWQKAIIVLVGFLCSIIPYMSTHKILDMVQEYHRFLTHFLVLCLFLFLKYFFDKINTEKTGYMKWLAGFADLVYPLYLLHVSIGLIIEWFIRNWCLAQSITPNSTLIVFIAFISVVLLSSITHIIIEKPSIYIGKTIVQKIKGRL